MRLRGTVPPERPILTLVGAHPHALNHAALALRVDGGRLADATCKALTQWKHRGGFRDVAVHLG
jgi:hypothetical protein